MLASTFGPDFWADPPSQFCGLQMPSPGTARFLSSVSEQGSDLEPELVRITSFESSASSEAFFRLFGRQGCAKSPGADALSFVERTKTFQSSFAECLPMEEGFCQRGIPGQNSPLVHHQGSPPGTTATTLPGDLGDSSYNCHVELEASCEAALGVCDASEQTQTTLQSLADLALAIDAEELFSGQAISNCQLDPMPSSAGTTCSMDPTCFVDSEDWAKQSLEEVLLQQPGGRLASEDKYVDAEVSCEEQFETSVANLISDPEIRAKIRSLRIFTSAAELALEAGQECPMIPGTEMCEVTREDEHLCSSPVSPPPLHRSLAAKRETVMDRCWLSKSQLRRKYSEVEDSSNALAPENSKRRRC